jgi:hypothetical protein
MPGGSFLVAPAPSGGERAGRGEDAALPGPTISWGTVPNEPFRATPRRIDIPHS